jgi:2-polyprenyl-6-methoxyphenol hydroxylase-like FAD-dependent oxidoreductase
LPKEQLSQRYRRASRMVGVMPCGAVPGRDGPHATVFWSLPSDGHAAWRAGGRAAWLADIAALWPKALPFFQQVETLEDMTFATYGHGTLRRPTGDRLAIIGDAGHRASPQLGQGANMALLDALALAVALDRWPVEEALGHYARARRWHVRIYQGMSAAFTPQYQSDSRWLPVLRDRVLFPLSQVPPLPRILTRLVCGDLLPPLASLGDVYGWNSEPTK